MNFNDVVMLDIVYDVVDFVEVKFSVDVNGL